MKEIAVILGLSVKTVEAHKFNLMRKLDIHNKAQLSDVCDSEKDHQDSRKSIVLLYPPRKEDGARKSAVFTFTLLRNLLT